MKSSMADEHNNAGHFNEDMASLTLFIVQIQMTGGFVHKQNTGPRYNARAIRTRCFCPPERLPPLAHQRFISHRHFHNIVVNIAMLGAFNDKFRIGMSIKTAYVLGN